MKIFSSILLILLGFQTFSQSDSTDLNFYTTNPILNNIEDSLLFNNESYKAYFLEFDITDTNNFGKVYVELVMNKNQPIYRKELSMTELVNLNLITGKHVKINFGNLNVENIYQVVILFENKEGFLNDRISKNYTE